MGKENNIDHWGYTHWEIAGKKFFPADACKMAEHKFLSFFLLLTEVNPDLAKKYVTDSMIRSFSREQVGTAHTIQKRTICYLDSNNIPFRYRFGSKTHLILTGELAGSICFRDKHFIDYLLFRNAVYTVRPIHDHGDVKDYIGYDKNGRTTGIFSKPSHYEIELLNRTIQLISDKNGFIPALLYCLEELQLEHNAAAIIKNSELAPSKLKKIPKYQEVSN